MVDDKIYYFRIDVVALKMANQDNMGNCVVDSFKVSGDQRLFNDQTLGLAPLCGSNNVGQHMYVGDFNVNAGDHVRKMLKAV